MFDFTTTTFIHDADMIEANPVSSNSTGTKSDKVLRLENKIFKYEDVVAIYHNPYVAPSNAKLYVDVAGFMDAASKIDAYKDAKRFKLDFYIRRSGDNNSFYSNDFVFKGKDFHYEWTNKQTTAKAVAKMINKIIRLYGDVYLKVYTETVDEKEVLVFENDNYAMFTEASLKVYLPEQSDCCTFREGGWETLDELCGPATTCTEGTGCDKVTYPEWNSENNADYYNAAYNYGSGTVQLGGWLLAHQGVNGFGTYEQLLKDLRLPTIENFRWTSPIASEMPVPGNKYDQYTIHQISCRGVLGGSAVGEVTHSKTTHVFFVPAYGCSEGLSEAVTQAIEDAGMESKLLVTTVGNPAIISDPTVNPVTVENFVHDPNTKANTVNDPLKASEEQEQEHH